MCTQHACTPTTPPVAFDSPHPPHAPHVFNTATTNVRQVPICPRRLPPPLPQVQPLAALPLRWDSRNVGGVNFITPVKEQGACGACVSFSVLAAAEAAMFSKLRPGPANTLDFSETVSGGKGRDKSNITGAGGGGGTVSGTVSGTGAPPALAPVPHTRAPAAETANAPTTFPDRCPAPRCPPPQDFFLCHTPRGSCFLGWDYRSAARALTYAGLIHEACRPYRSVMSDACPARSPACTSIPAGTFHPVIFSSIEGMQFHITAHGAVATGFLVFKDFMTWWFAGAQGVYTKKVTWLTMRQDPPIGAHAVTVVGYDNVGQFWIAKNSWGDTGDAGYFKIAYGSANFMAPTEADSMGVVWQPQGAPVQSIPRQGSPPRLIRPDPAPDPSPSPSPSPYPKPHSPPPKRKPPALRKPPKPQMPVRKPPKPATGSKPPPQPRQANTSRPPPPEGQEASSAPGQVAVFRSDSGGDQAGCILSCWRLCCCAGGCAAVLAAVLLAVSERQGASAAECCIQGPMQG
jgi:hypothetical protein